MTLLETVMDAFNKGKKQYEDMMAWAELPEFAVWEEYGRPDAREDFRNAVALTDNVTYMAHLVKNQGMAGKIQLIYVDPPFFSKGKYQASVRINSELAGKSDIIKTGAYDDRWGGDISKYIEMLTTRLFFMRDLLTETGCIWVHLDWHVVHYAKVILDEILGEDNFVNEIIWTYKSGGANKRSFAKKHDTLLFYAKSGSYYFNALKEKSYNRGYKPYRFKGVEEFVDERGWYTLVNMKDVWNIDMVGRTSSERNGYATQKPEKLLERIIEACSREGDICADFFAGSGTLGAVCHRLGRRWLMCDAGSLSAACQIDRLGALGADFVLTCADAADRRKRNGELKARIDNGEVVLEDYRIIDTGIEEAAFSTDEKGLREIRSYLKRDCLSLIKCWSVDEDYDGKTHRAEKIMTGDLRRCMLEKGATTVSIRGYDLLGNVFSCIVRSEE